MVAGYFLHRPEAAPWCDKIYIRKQVERYVVSFFIWSSIFFLLVHHEGILKNIVRTVYAGYNNITPYGYPFWFINALLVGGFTLTCIRWGKEMVNRRGGGNLEQWIVLMFPIVALWSVAQWILPLPRPLPWSLDQMCGAIMYMAIGAAFRDYVRHWWHGRVAVFCCIVFVCWQLSEGVSYHLNMSSMSYSHPLLDILVPFFFSLALYYISIMVDKILLLRNILSYIGICSITIFFTHAYILDCVRLLSFPVQTAIIVVVGMAIHFSLNCFSITRRLFFGKV